MENIVRADPKIQFSAQLLQLAQLGQSAQSAPVQSVRPAGSPESLADTPESKFLSLPFEDLMRVDVGAPMRSHSNIEIQVREAGVVESKPVDFLNMSFSELTKIPVRVATVLNQDKKDKKEAQEVENTGISSEAKVPATFSDQSKKSVATPSVHSVPKQIEGESSSEPTEDTNPPITPPTPPPPLIKPIPVPQLLTVSNNLSGTISVLVNNRNGTFTEKATLLVSGLGNTPGPVGVGDFNGDGLLDIAAGDQNLNQIDIFLATGVGTFNAPIVGPSSNNPFCVVTADFNRDGLLDLAVTNPTASQLSIFLGLGSATFGPPTILPTGGTGPRSIAIGDFNGDGVLDLAVANFIGSNVSIFLGTGSGSFNFSTSFPSGGSNPFNIITTDVNNDGILDLVVANSNTNGSFATFLGTGTGTFGSAIAYAVSGARFVAAGDFNKDGNIDLAVGLFNSNLVSIYFGTGTGAFTHQYDLVVRNPLAGVATDVNADGIYDLIVTSSVLSAPEVIIFLGDETGNFQSSASYPVQGTPIAISLGFVPAGVSGAPINLALSDLENFLYDNIYENVSVTINNIPSDWVLNTGVNHFDGSWTLSWNDLSVATITSTPDFVGARALPMVISWVSSEGMIESFSLINNIEVYAPNSPIFALPMGDNLSGSKGADCFVISKSLSQIQDKIFNFDIKNDQINLLDFTDREFSDLVIINDMYGNAIVNIDNIDAGCHSVLLFGIDSDDLTEQNFAFNMPVTTINNNIIDIGLESIMPFRGTLENNGVIRVDGTMIVEGDVMGEGSIVLGSSGVLKLKGSLMQDLILETDSLGSGFILFNHQELTFEHLTTISIKTILENAFETYQVAV